MSIKKFVIVAFASTIAFTPVIAQAPTDAQNAADEADETTASNSIVCRRAPAPTGSRIGSRRICKTEVEWQRIQQEARDTMENAGTRSRFGNE